MANRLRTVDKKVYFSNAEWHIVEKNMKKANLDFSKYSRKMLTEGKIIVRDFSMLKEVNKIGTNINQLARIANTDRSISNETVNQLLIEYQKMLDLYYSLIIDDES